MVYVSWQLPVLLIHENFLPRCHLGLRIRMIFRKVPKMVKKNLQRILRSISTSHCFNKSLQSLIKVEESKIRNIGILAHIDAGKTTTTERMLFYSGIIRNMGEVHHGNTVTDYMVQERNRGITIKSAAVTFPWNGHCINLVDTPGHIDFTMEVEQSLNVIDGVIVVLDGSAGVEAQTVTVWRQADRYQIPRIVYNNKMDRSDASLNIAINTLQSKLSVIPLPIHLPITKDKKLIELVDLITLEKCTWSGTQGTNLKKQILTEEDGLIWSQSKLEREKLIDKLTDIDNVLADTVIGLDSFDQVTKELLAQSIRRVTLTQQGVPLLCGSSYKNIGVQLLMDAVIDYLPSPTECRQHEIYSAFEENIAAKAFKVVHDKQRGPVVFLRLYSGKLNKGQKVFNMKQEKSEQIGKLMIAEADDYEEVAEVSEGNICAVTGLKQTVPGELLTSSSSVANTVRQNLSKKLKIEQLEVDSKINVGAHIPDPVFFCSIEPYSQAYQQPLEMALSQLQREDPSLRVTFDEETGQTVLAGMGELHLEIIKDRIMSEYKIEVDIGPLQIAYREMLLDSVQETHNINLTVGTGHHTMKVVLSLLPGSKKELISLDKSKENAANTSAITPKQLHNVKQGLKSALAHGPILGSPVIDVNVILHWLEVGRGSSDTIIAAGVSQCIKKMLSSAGTALLEPIMSLEVVTDDNFLPVVLSDLSRRRTAIQQISLRGPNKVVDARTPLSELLGYSRDLRTITSGTATFTMEFDSFQKMTPLDQAKAIKTVTGF